MRRLHVLCMRERRGCFDADASLALDVALPELPDGFHPAPLGGWEPNERGKAGPRTADLAPAMDPRQLAEAAVQLNLRLMRWRAAPALDVGAIGGELPLPAPSACIFCLLTFCIPRRACTSASACCCCCLAVASHLWCSGCARVWP